MHIISAADLPLLRSNSAWKCHIPPAECSPQKSLNILLKILLVEFIQAWAGEGVKKITLRELVELATESSAFGDRLLGFILNMWLTPGQTYICYEVVRLLVGRGQSLALGTFFRVFVGQLKGTVSPPFCLFWQTLGGLNLTRSLFLSYF